MSEIFGFGWNRYGQCPKLIDCATGSGGGGAASASIIVCVSCSPTATLIVCGDGSVRVIGSLFPSPQPPLTASPDSGEIGGGGGNGSVKRKRLELPPPKTDPNPAVLVTDSDATGSGAKKFKPTPTSAAAIITPPPPPPSNSFAAVSIPLSVPSPHRIVKVSCGWAHTALISDLGVALALGSNSWGQCGTDTGSGSGGGVIRTPTAVVFESSGAATAGSGGGSSVVIESASCGERHTLFVNRCGRLFACGRNWNGLLGLGGAAPDACDEKGKTTALNECVFTPTRVRIGGAGGADSTEPIPPSHRVTVVSAGWNHSALITADGGVWTFGLGLTGSLGHGDSNTEYTPRCVYARRVLSHRMED